MLFLKAHRLREITLDAPHQRPKSQRRVRHTFGQLLRQLTLTDLEQLGDHPRSSMRISPPILVEPVDQSLRQERLELPRAEVPRGVVARVYVHERFRGIVAEGCRRGEALD